MALWFPELRFRILVSCVKRNLLGPRQVNETREQHLNMSDYHAWYSVFQVAADEGLVRLLNSFVPRAKPPPYAREPASAVDAAGIDRRESPPLKMTSGVLGRDKITDKNGRQWRCPHAGGDESRGKAVLGEWYPLSLHARGRGSKQRVGARRRLAPTFPPA